MNDETADRWNAYRSALHLAIDGYEDRRIIGKAESDMLKAVKGLRTITEITRKSFREFDINFSGTQEIIEGSDMEPVNFSAWLPLAFIHDSNWPMLSQLTDYPDMVADGDWSGIRDSSEETKWRIFSGLRRATEVLANA